MSRRWLAAPLVLVVLTRCGPASAPPVTREPIAASVVSYLPQGERAILILNRGSRAGVAFGDVARMSGFAEPCIVCEVYEFRAKCITSGSWRGARGTSIHPPAAPPTFKGCGGVPHTPPPPPQEPPP